MRMSSVPVTSKPCPVHEVETAGGADGRFEHSVWFHLHPIDPPIRRGLDLNIQYQT